MSEATPTSQVMTADLARNLFDEMSADSPADFSLIDRHCHPDVRFRDPIQQLRAATHSSRCPRSS